MVQVLSKRGFEVSTHCHGWDYKTVQGYVCRRHLNHPPTSVGGISGFLCKAPVGRHLGLCAKSQNLIAQIIRCRLDFKSVGRRFNNLRNVDRDLTSVRRVLLSSGLIRALSPTTQKQARESSANTRGVLRIAIDNMAHLHACCKRSDPRSMHQACSDQHKL